MANIVETLGNELEQIDREYAAEFAGQSRHTRDTDLLDRLVRRLQSVVERVDQIPAAVRGPELAKLRDAAVSSLELYTNERGAIVRARQVGPMFEQFASEATSANFTFAKYARHFAGKDRATRDVALLGELIDDLRQIEKRMTQIIEKSKSTDFERDREVVRQNLTQYQREVELIQGAQTSGTPDEQASALATIANGQFAIYQAHFAGEPRVSRRPTLLVRMISTLKRVKERMSALKDAGLTADFNDKNLAIVADRLGVYESELAEIRKVRQATPMASIMGELGGAANQLFDEYRSNFADKPRAGADTDRLGRICDKLGEIRRQMVEMSWAEDNEMNLKNLDIVTEQLSMFESEYEAVVRAQQPAR